MQVTFAHSLARQSTSCVQAKPVEQASVLAPENQLDSQDLLRGQKSIEIKHNGALYRLQATKLGKLILTK